MVAWILNNTDSGDDLSSVDVKPLPETTLAKYNNNLLI